MYISDDLQMKCCTDIHDVDEDSKTIYNVGCDFAYAQRGGFFDRECQLTAEHYISSVAFEQK